MTFRTRVPEDPSHGYGAFGLHRDTWALAGFYPLVAVRKVFIEIPDEDRCEGDEDRCGELLYSLYGTGDADQNREA